MRFLFIIFFLIGLNFCNAYIQNDGIKFVDNGVIAHRGAWKQKNLPENSIASLKHAIELHCAGSEFDVRMTADDVLIVNHDAFYHGMLIEETRYAKLAKFKLSNGEALSTLRDYLLAGIGNNISTGLICEVKPSKSKERGQVIAQKVIELVKELNAESFISSYISFDYDILKRIVQINPQLKTQYLSGTKTPEVLKADGISGLDYHFDVLSNHPDWIHSAKELGLSLNAWTVNEAEHMDYLLANDFDFITTNEPELLFERINESPACNGYKLIWSDEFNYKGRPDPSKWAYDYRFIANKEKQYYVDSLKNARIENGHLIIEAHEEKIANKDYGNNEIKGFAKYKAQIDTAQFTSARLKTEGLAEWKYVRMEVRAKLPKGRGLWPAIWMLGENRKDAGWPECGEIDIMEHVGYDNDTIHGTIHTKSYNHLMGTQKGKTIFIDEPQETFHVFSLDWSPDKLDFLLDGVVYNRIENEHKTTAEWPFDQNFYLILNVAVGGTWGGQKGIDTNVFPQRMVVDYVRVYQLK